LRAQQVIAHESGVADFVDPLAGSDAGEGLTSELERRARELLARLDERGGMVAAIEQGFPHKEIERRAYEHQQAVERKERVVVGVNEYLVDEPAPRDLQRIGPQLDWEQVARGHTP